MALTFSFKLNFMDPKTCWPANYIDISDEILHIGYQCTGDGQALSGCLRTFPLFGWRLWFYGSAFSLSGFEASLTGGRTSSCLRWRTGLESGRWKVLGLFELLVIILFFRGLWRSLISSLFILGSARWVWSFY